MAKVNHAVISKFSWIDFGELQLKHKDTVLYVDLR